jgi:DNA repair exonuclease
MRASFMHIADTHLGYEQYGVRERFNDFTHAFWDIIEEALNRKIDFMIVAGDLFNKRAIDALTLIHAIEGFRKLHDRGIPVIAIEGNHDRSYYRDGISWLQFLCYQGYIKLLAPVMQEGIPQLTPWDAKTMLGSYIDLLDGRLRVYGLPWQGAATTRSLEGFAQTLKAAADTPVEQGIEYRLLMMHTGIDGYVPRVQGLPPLAQFQPLRDSIDYLALGHVHKPYERDGWIYNPGSPETCSAEEVQWTDRGYYYVEIDTDEPERIIDSERKERVHHAQRLANKRRSFVRHNLRVDGLQEPDLLYARLEEYCRRESPAYKDLQPVVLVHIVGTLLFDVGVLDIPRMEEMVRGFFAPLYVRIENATNDQDYVGDDSDLDGHDRTHWHELEHRIFAELVGQDSRYFPAREQWSTVISELKSSALHKDDPEQIAQFLREKRKNLLSL